MKRRLYWFTKISSIRRIRINYVMIFSSIRSFPHHIKDRSLFLWPLIRFFFVSHYNFFFFFSIWSRLLPHPRVFFFFFPIFSSLFRNMILQYTIWHKCVPLSTNPWILSLIPYDDAISADVIRHSLHRVIIFSIIQLQSSDFNLRDTTFDSFSVRFILFKSFLISCSRHFIKNVISVISNIVFSYKYLCIFISYSRNLENIWLHPSPISSSFFHFKYFFLLQLCLLGSD